MVMNEINELSEFKVLLSDTVSISYREKTYPITDVKINAYAILLIANTGNKPLTGKQLMDKIYDIFTQFSNINRFDRLELVIRQNSVMYFNKPFESKEILTIKSNENENIRKYSTILYSK